LKIITNTLIIATLFTANITASQICHGLQCYASFGKPANYKPSIKKFNRHDRNTVSMPVVEPTFQDVIIETDTNDNNNFRTDSIAENTINGQGNEIEIFEPIVVSEEIIYPNPVSSVDEGQEYDSSIVQSTEYSDEIQDLDYATSVEPILVENSTNNEEKIIKLTLNQETLCKEGNEVIPCDTVQSEDSECVCV